MHAEHPMRDGLPPEWADGFGFDEFGPYAEVYIDDATLRMRWIPPGTFTMGSPEDEEGRYDREVQHKVTLTEGYWLADVPVTQALWQTVTDKNPSHFRGPHRPVESVSWDDLQTFIDQLNAQVPELDARLPTEAEWEYACRAETTTARYGELDAVAWHGRNSGDETHPVREKQPNAWGMYDMLGNVLEWCADRWLHRYEPGAATNPTGPAEGSGRVLRGGSWDGSARLVRAAYRSGLPPGRRFVFLGFRLSRGPAPSARSAEPPRSGPGGAESKGERPWSGAEGSRVSGGAAVPEADPGSGGARERLRQAKWSAWRDRPAWLMHDVPCAPDPAVYLLWYRDNVGEFRTVAIGVDAERRCLTLYEIWHDALLNVGESPWVYAARGRMARIQGVPEYQGVVHRLHALPDGSGERELHIDRDGQSGLHMLGLVDRWLMLATEEAPSDFRALDLRTRDLTDVSAVLLDDGPGVGLALSKGGSAEMERPMQVRPVFDEAGDLNMRWRYPRAEEGRAQPDSTEHTEFSEFQQAKIPELLSSAADTPEPVRRFLSVRHEGFLGWSTAPTVGLDVLDAVESRRYELRFGALAPLMDGDDEVKTVFDGTHPRSAELMRYADREIAKLPWREVLSDR